MKVSVTIPQGCSVLQLTRSLIMSWQWWCRSFRGVLWNEHDDRASEGRGSDWRFPDSSGHETSEARNGANRGKKRALTCEKNCGIFSPIGIHAKERNKRTNERTNGQKNEQTNGRTNKQMEERTNERTKERTNERKNEHTKERTNKRTKRRTSKRRKERTHEWQTYFLLLTSLSVFCFF